MMKVFAIFVLFCIPSFSLFAQQKNILDSTYLRVTWDSNLSFKTFQKALRENQVRNQDKTVMIIYKNDLFKVEALDSLIATDSCKVLRLINPPDSIRKKNGDVKKVILLE